NCALHLLCPRSLPTRRSSDLLKFSRPTLLEEACLGLPAGQQGESWRVEKILLGLGFSKEDFTRPPEAFSGGFQVRLNLAKILARSEEHTSELQSREKLVCRLL